MTTPDSVVIIGVLMATIFTLTGLLWRTSRKVLEIEDAHHHYKDALQAERAANNSLRRELRQTKDARIKLENNIIRQIQPR